jgi:hypothetical protein
MAERKDFWEQRGWAFIDAAVFGVVIWGVQKAWPRVIGSNMEPVFFGGLTVVAVLFLLLLQRQLARTLSAELRAEASRIELQRIANETSARSAKLERDRALAEAEELRKQLPPPSALNPAQRFEVEFLRTVWVNQGHDACNMTSQLLDAVVTYGRERKEPTIVALRDRWSELRNRIDRFSPVIDPDSDLTWDQRKDALVELVLAYVRAVGWVTHFRSTHPGLELSREYNLQMWKNTHSAFARSLADTLAPRSAYSGLRLIINPDADEIRPPSS